MTKNVSELSFRDMPCIARIELYGVIFGIIAPEASGNAYGDYITFGIAKRDTTLAIMAAHGDTMGFLLPEENGGEEDHEYGAFFNYTDVAECLEDYTSNVKYLEEIVSAGWKGV